MKRPWYASSATEEITLVTPCKKIKTFETCVETFEKTKTTETPIDKKQVKRPTIVRIKLRKPSEAVVASPAGNPGARTDCPPVERPGIVAAPKQPNAETNVKLAPQAKPQKRDGFSSYEELIENWVPPPLHFSFNDDTDEEWLFGKRQHNKERESKRYEPRNEVLGCRGSITMGPQAQLLPDAGGLYALPYTVPF